MKSRITIKRAYEPASKLDGRRFLVDRLWPRGIKKEKLKMTAWCKDVAPSSGLRTWFGHDPKKWDLFRERYIKELRANRQALQPLLAAAPKGPLTLLYGAKDPVHNHALVLKGFLEKERGRYGK